MKIHRNKYDTAIPWLYNQNKEYLLPEQFRKTIPYSTISTWKNEHLKPYYGAEFSSIRNESLEWYELFHERKHLQKTVKVLTKVWIGVSKLLAPVIQKSKEHSGLFIDSVRQLATVFPKRLACRIARISVATFNYRIFKLKFKCGISALDLCFRRHPLQLMTKEVEKIRSAFTDPSFCCWPAISIYYKLIRENQLCISLSTFYKYVRILGLQRAWPKAISKTVGIVSSRPNEYLHVDTTFWELSSGEKAAIVFVSDNYSKAILSWEVALKNTAQNVRNALQKAIHTIHEFHPLYMCPVTLVADGGSENHALTVDELLQTCEKPAIHKVIARKDITFSNSPIEAVNKIMKRYLRHHKPDDLPKLTVLLPEIISDYMTERPHGSLKGLTPMEAYTQKSVSVDFKIQIQAAKAIRTEQNRKANCGTCS